MVRVGGLLPVLAGKRAGEAAPVSSPAGRTTSGGQLERLVMRAVVRDGLTGDVGRLGAADGLTVLRVRGAEAALEPTPGDALGVQEVADVAAGQRNQARLRVGAVVELRVGITNHRAGDLVALLQLRPLGTVRVAGD